MPRTTQDSPLPAGPEPSTPPACITGETAVATSEGMRRADQISNGDVVAMVGIDPNGIMPDPSNRRMRIDPSVLNNPIADRRMRASSPLAEDAGGPVILAGDESGLVNAMEAFLRGLFTADGHVSINGDIEPNSTRYTSNA